MHVESNCRDRRQRRAAAGLMLMLAGFAGVGGAVEFDERVKAPLMKDAGTLRAQAQSFSARFAELQAAGPEQLITNRTLAGERFNLAWQIQQAIDVGRPLGDVSDIGFVNRGDGSFSIDLNAFPQWERVDRKLSQILPHTHWEVFAHQLMSRGMTQAATVKLKDFVDTHDVRAMTHQRLLPISLSFAKLVGKFDKLKRPVTDATVLAYVYQRERAASEATRDWAASLVAALDAHSVRILLSTVNEGSSHAVWAPSDQPAGIADILATVRRPDFEQRAISQATGETP